MNNLETLTHVEKLYKSIEISYKASFSIIKISTDDCRNISEAEWPNLIYVDLCSTSHI